MPALAGWARELALPIVKPGQALVSIDSELYRSFAPDPASTEKSTGHCMRDQIAVVYGRYQSLDARIVSVVLDATLDRFAGRIHRLPGIS